MKKDFKRPNGTIKRIQMTRAPRAMVSSMGSKIKKGDKILHLSSSRATGETWVFTDEDLWLVSRWPVGRWHGPKEWTEQLHKKWKKNLPASDDPRGVTHPLTEDMLPPF